MLACDCKNSFLYETYHSDYARFNENKSVAHITQHKVMYFIGFRKVWNDKDFMERIQNSFYIRVNELEVSCIVQVRTCSAYYMRTLMNALFDLIILIRVNK